MFVLDAWEIGQMPKRGTPSLWWVRILTDFGKDEYVLAVLGGLLIAVAIVSPALHGIQRSLLLGLGTRLQFLFCAVAVSALVTEVLKVQYRPRPAVCRRRGQRLQLLALRGKPGLLQLSRPATPRRLSRSPSPCPSSGPRRALRWPSMP